MLTPRMLPHAGYTPGLVRDRLKSAGCFGLT
jgi:hypothetical protein